MESESPEYLPHSSGCFLCGDENPCGARTRFFVDGDTVRTRLRLPRHMNGYLHTAHGGVLAGLLDETMGWAATVFGARHVFYVTGELTVKYIAPVPVEADIEIVGRLVKDAGRIAYSEGELFFQGKVCLKAKGKFIPLSDADTAGVLPYLKFELCRKYRDLFGKNSIIQSTQGGLMTKNPESKTLEELLAEADELIRQFDTGFRKSLEDGPRLAFEEQVQKIGELKAQVQKQNDEKGKGEAGSFGEGIHEAVLDIVQAMKDLSRYFS